MHCSSEEKRKLCNGGCFGLLFNKVEPLGFSRFKCFVFAQFNFLSFTEKFEKTTKKAVKSKTMHIVHSVQNSNVVN